MAVQVTTIKKIEKVFPKLAEKKRFRNCAALLPYLPFLLKYVVVLACVGLVIRQVAECIQKLVDPPITTYTHFDFNKTIEYPSLTFCREPAYKFNELRKYGLYAHPRFTSMWRNFDFSNTSLEQLWNETTYNENEVFIQYGLNGEKKNVKISSTLGLIMGRCYTLSPLALGTKSTRHSGYSITLQHHKEDVANNVGNSPAGYHVFVHYTKEPFTEVEVYNGGLVDYLMLKTGETIDVKLTVDEYKKLNKDNDPCIRSRESYSTNECTTWYVWDKVVRLVGCSGPWIKSKLAPCSDRTAMTHLISAYMSYYNKHDSSCPRLCRSFLYNSYVTDRHMYRWDTVTQTMVAKDLPENNADLQIQLYVYFNGMMVSVYEESYNYDWTHFVADLGGSIGFLLGLSVISLMTILSKMWALLLKGSVNTKSPGLDTMTTTPEEDHRGSITTIAVGDLDKDSGDDRKWKEWNFGDIGNFI